MGTPTTRRWLVEGAVIVVSILLAFGVDAAWDARQERRAEGVILASLVADFETVRDLLPLHHREHARTVAAVDLAWVFEVTPEGVRRTDEAAPAPAEGAHGWLSARALAAAGVLVLLAGSVGWFVGGRRASPAPAAGAEAVGASIAVLPFTNTSGDPENEGFTNGLHDDLLTHLSRVAALRVISRTSVMAYRETDKTLPEIARELGVTVILEGGVQRVGDNVRVNAQLIDALADEHLWAEIYDERVSVESLLGIQASIARRIAESLSAHITPEEERELLRPPTESATAYEFYLRGNDALRRVATAYDGMAAERAHQLFHRALELDPDFAEARAALAYALMWTDDDADSLYVEARREAEAALAVDPSFARAHLAMAMVLGRSREPGALLRARSAIERAYAHAPSDPEILHDLSWFRADEERYEEALALADRLAELDPRSILPGEIRSEVWILQRRYDEALAQLREDDALVTRSVEQPLWGFTRAQISAQLARDGDARTALATFDDFNRRFERTPAQIVDDLADVPSLIREGAYGDLIREVSADHPDAAYRCGCMWAKAWLHRLEGREAESRALWARVAEERLAGEEEPWHASEAFRRSGIAKALARAGRGDAARRQVERAFELAPELTAGTLTELALDRAHVSAALGEAEAALVDIEDLLSRPSGLSVGLLKVEPMWDPIRADPRFQAMLARYGGP